MVNGSGIPRGNRRGPKSGKRRTPSPSRLRYEARNPVVSVRVTVDMRAALDDLRVKGDVSIADVLRAGLELMSPTIGEAYNNGVTYASAEIYRLACDECEDLVIEFFNQHQNTQGSSRSG